MTDESKPTVLVDSAEKDPRLPEYELRPCPSCGGGVESGFGLAGGGFGPYTYCPRCEIITSKSVTDD